MEEEHRRQITELKQELADAKRQHTKTGSSLVIYAQNTTL